MLEMGVSKPWPDALEAFTGERQMSGEAMVEYFAPLMDVAQRTERGQPRRMVRLRIAPRPCRCSLRRLRAGRGADDVPRSAESDSVGRAVRGRQVRQYARPRSIGSGQQVPRRSIAAPIRTNWRCHPTIAMSRWPATAGRASTSSARPIWGERSPASIWAMARARMASCGTRMAISTPLPKGVNSIFWIRDPLGEAQTFEYATGRGRYAYACGLA